MSQSRLYKRQHYNNFFHYLWAVCMIRNWDTKRTTPEFEHMARKVYTGKAGGLTKQKPRPPRRTAIRVLEQRLTHKYKPNWSHLDQYGGVKVTIKMLNGRHYTQWELEQIAGNDPDKVNYDMSEAGASYCRVRVLKTSGPISDYDIGRVLVDYFQYGGCDCPGDCCGCASGSPTATKVGRRDWKVVTRISRNF